MIIKHQKLSSKTISIIGIAFNVFLFANIIICANGLPQKSEIDSVKSVLRECDTDTCKFTILKNLFWKHRGAGSDNAEYYGEWAFQVIKNTKDKKYLADGYDIKANLMLKKREPDSARYFLQQALAISKNIRYDFRTAWSYFGLGEIADSYGNFKEAVENFKSAKKYVKIFSSPELIGKLNGFIASNYFRLGSYDSAIVYFEKNISIIRKYKKTRQEIVTSINLSFCYNKINNVKKASEYIYNALSAAESINDESLLMSVYCKIGEAFFDERNDYSTARSYYFRALELSQKLDNKKMTATIYGLIGRSYLSEGINDKALEYNLKSLKVSQDINYRHSLSNSYSFLGHTYKKLGNNKLALEYFRKSWETGCDFCPPISFHEPLFEMANIYLTKNNFKQALECFQQSLDIAEKANANAEIAKSHFGIGEYFRKINQPVAAENQYLKSLAIARGVKSIPVIKEIADTLSRFYLRRGNYKSGAEFLQLAYAMNDSLFQSERKSSMADLEMKFEFERLQKDNDAKITQKNTYLYFLIFAFISISILGSVICVSFRRKQKDNILLSRQKDEIEKMSCKLHEADQTKLRFFTNISHELRTPLTLIVSPLSKLFKNETNDESKNLLSIMIKNARKLQMMIDQLLDVSKLDKGEIKLNQQLNDFNKLVRTTSAMFQSIAEEKKIDFRIIELDKNVFFCFDSGRMEQILNNLLSNAFKFTDTGGEIVLTISTDENPEKYPSDQNYAVLKIRDNGIGIPPESLGKVFDRFYQSDLTIKKDFGGSGIGLALTKELVELHGGTISVQSQTGIFTEFTVKFPMVILKNEIPDEDNLEDEISSGAEILKHESNTKPFTVLVVEDNEDLRTYLIGSLSNEFNVIAAVNGSNGVELAVKKIPDIILSDIMMPQMDGYQLTGILKENINTSHIPIILLTAKAGRDSKLEGLGKGADDYIIKPFDEEELFLRIRNSLSNRKRLQEKYRKQISVNPSEVNVQSIDDKFLSKLTGIVEEEISNPGLNVDFVCDKIGLSRPQLYRKLKALTDLSINHFIRTIRLKRAAQLIEKKSGSISEIAYTTGFENLSYFTKKFKEEFGKLPSEY